MGNYGRQWVINKNICSIFVLNKYRKMVVETIFITVIYFCYLKFICLLFNSLAKTSDTGSRSIAIS